MNRNEKYEKMKNENGDFELDGKLYILTQQAYPDGTHEHPYFTAGAFCTSDKVDEDGWQPYYIVKWEITDFYQFENAEQDCACDWDKPIEVRKCGEYNLEEDSVY